MYGPTETTIWSTCQVVPEHNGGDCRHRNGPIANTQVYVLDDDAASPVPTGVPGELFIGRRRRDGSGYWQRP